jgi:hypothetical protein
MDSLNRPESINATRKKFVELYETVYPGRYFSDPADGEKFAQTLDNINFILYIWDDMCSGVSDPSRILDYHVEKKNPTFQKAIWLFWKSETTFSPDDLIRLVVELDDLSLTESDYALLLFLSYQDVKTQALIKALPLSMLHDMYEPLAEANFEKWFKAEFAKTGLGW